MSKPIKNILVTGVSGFVGTHLTHLLLDAGYAVVGTDHREHKDKDFVTKLKSYHVVDLTDQKEVEKFEWSEIDGVIHLAGLAAVGPSFDNPSLYMNVHANMISSLFESASSHDVKPKFIVVSSGAVYGKSDTPIDEEAETFVGSPYAASKLSSEILTEYYVNRGFEAVVARPFNHIGPGQGQGFIVPDLAQQIADQRGKGKTVIKAGNLLTRRDYTDVRDVANAYIELLKSDKTNKGVYNICSGKSYSGEEILDMLLEIEGVKDASINTEVSKLRPTDNPEVVGDNTKLKTQTNWSPKYDIKSTLKEVLETI